MRISDGSSDVCSSDLNLPQAHVAVRRNVGLAARYPAARGAKQAQAKGGHRARISAALQMRALVRADRAVEIETEIRAAIKGIGRCVHIGAGDRKSVV